MTTNMETLSKKKQTAFVNRTIPLDGLDFYPTPPWATRALFESGFKLRPSEVVWEPACGLYHMSNTIKEYHPYDNGIIATDLIHGHDFLKDKPHDAHWIITNPPYNICTEFTVHALETAKRGVAMFVRYPFLETQKRYHAIFSMYKPAKIYQFYERVQLVQNKVAKKGPTAVVYVWVIWDNEHEGPTHYEWISKTRTELEKESDYDV